MSFKKALMSLAITFCSASAYAQDVTKQFTDYLDHYWVGSRSSADRVWDNTFCAVPRPGGGCIEKGGSKIYATANGTVQAASEQFGNGWYIEKQKNPWTGVEIVSHWVDLQISYPYSGVSSGRKQCFPGDFYCGMEWDSLHPAGIVRVAFKADGQKFWVKMTYEVFQGHGDKPNAVLRDAMYNLREKMRLTVVDFVRMIGSEAQVEVE